MTYDLARKLKEKGFPQKSKGVYMGEEYEDNVSIPTLTELIEACGDRFAQLHKWSGGEEKEKWMACSESNWGNTPDGIEAYGNTAEEAVAHLYLEIHK